MANQSSESLAAGTVLAGRYRVERQLGRGGMGSVYLVQHLHTEQQLALKLLHEAIVTDEMALTRFRREARAPARISSDHVVQVTDADVAPELGGVPFLVMEWLRGHDLEELSNERRKLPAEDVVLYLRHAARALDKAHALGIVHRDLKPENLFLTSREDGTPCLKLLDFGIAKLTSGEDGRLKATGTGQIFGTPLYMSPEQTKGETDRICPQTDIWALGVIAHRLLTGVEPWTAATLTALVAQIAYEPLPVPSKRGHDLGPAFDAWFARACAREPSGRFATAGEAALALGSALRVPDEAHGSSRASAPVAIAGPRDDSDRTAFSATAPASSIHLGVSATKLSPVAPPSRSRLMLFAGAIAMISAASAAAYVSSQRAPTPASSAMPVASVAVSEAAPPVAPSVTVTPSTAAPTATTAPTASAEVVPRPTAEPKRPTRPVVTAPKPPVTTAPAPPAAPTPAQPEDPLGTRH